MVKKDKTISTTPHKVMYLVQHSFQKQTFRKRTGMARQAVCYLGEGEGESAYFSSCSTLVVKKKKKSSLRFQSRAHQQQILRDKYKRKRPVFSQKLISSFICRSSSADHFWPEYNQQNGDFSPRVSQIQRCLLQYLSICYIYAPKTPHKEQNYCIRKKKSGSNERQIHSFRYPCIRVRDLSLPAQRQSVTEKASGGRFPTSPPSPEPRDCSL